MNLLRSFVSGAALTVLLAADVSYAADLNLAGLPLHAERGRARALRERLPEARSIVMLIDARRTQTARWLDELAESGFTGAGSVIIVVGETTSGERVGRQRLRLSAASWASAPLNTTLAHLDTSTLPAIYGIDAEGFVQWRLPVSGRRADEIALRIRDWLQHEPRSAPESK